MKSDEFWSVELGVRMGPLVLGTEYSQLLQILRDHRIDVDRLTLNRSGKLSVPEIRTQLIFGEFTPKTLERIEVEDERLKFGSLSVIGKRVHEILGLFKISRKRTLWCSNEINGEVLNPTTKHDPTALSRELLASGTLWIPSLGLGLTLRNGLIAKVLLCDPVHSPRIGIGSWTKEQQLLSEVRELPTNSIAPIVRNHKSILSPLLHLALFASIGILIWWAIQMQRRWDAAPDVPAVVVAVDPPPPNAFPDTFTVSFIDSKGIERRQTLGYTQFYRSPNLGEEVNIRYLREAPEAALGPVGFRDVGFNTIVPYGIGVLAIYSLLQLVVLGASSRFTRVQ